jgi:hypothetical protein
MSDTPEKRYMHERFVRQARQALQLADGSVAAAYWPEASRHTRNALAWIKAAQREAEEEKD